MRKIIKNDLKFLQGEIVIPPDKSISHRAVIFSTLAKGKSIIKNFSQGQDPQSSLEICKTLGAQIDINGTTVTVNSDGVLKNPSTDLYCGNSGTTMRLMSGVLAGRDFESTLTGDESLSARPMKRIVEPLELMGASIISNNFKAPIHISPSKLHGITYNSQISSAQVKSCILLAGLNAIGKTIYTEPYLSRNHTELMLKSMGANICTDKNTVIIDKSELAPINMEVCSDISSAAYFLVAGLIIPNSKIILRKVNINPTRTGIIDVIKMMNGNIEILDIKNSDTEPVADIKVQYSPDMNGCVISSNIIPRLIDEIPVIALLATQCSGKTIIKDAQDLRNKESDRIQTTVNELQKLGANIKQTHDGMVIEGKSNLIGDTEVNSYRDHRLAMTLYVAGLICKNEIQINDFEWVKISFPEFEKIFCESLKL